MKKELILYCSVKDIEFSPPEVDKKAKGKVITEISNAWKNATIIDSKGWLWVSIDKLHSILRTNKQGARYIAMQISDEFKQNYNNKTYIRGYKILEIISRNIEEDGVGTKGVYLDTSKKYYDSINSSDKAKLIRLEYDTNLKQQKRKLKNKRIRKYNIELDELTIGGARKPPPLGVGMNCSVLVFF